MDELSDTFGLEFTKKENLMDDQATHLGWDFLKRK